MSEKTVRLDQYKRFEEAANPHAWFLTASNLHDQATELFNRRGRGYLRLTRKDAPDLLWDSTNKATFLLAAFAMENAIKAFLVYEHPSWISNGRLDPKLCSHKLVALATKSTLMPQVATQNWVLSQLEEGNESWMRYPCSRSINDLRIEPDFSRKLWSGYVSVMANYEAGLRLLLAKGWQGPYGDFGTWKVEGNWLS